MNAYMKRMAEKYIGLTSISSKGQKMEVVEYFGANDITVRFEDDTLVYHKSIADFKKGKISNPNFFKSKFLGMSSVSSQGQKMKIIEYFDYNNATVEFEEGTIVKNINVNNFLRGAVENPNLVRKSKKNWQNHYIGMTLVSKFGLKMTIIEYFSSRNMTVQFEDGYIVKNVKLTEFKKRTSLGHPKADKSKMAIERAKTKYIGLKSLSSDGFSAEIVEYFSYNNITIKFTDGTFKKGLKVNDFENHNFAKYKNFAMPFKAKNYLHPCGLKYKLIDYVPDVNNQGGAIIEFEDGTIVDHVRKRRFLEQDFGHTLINKAGSKKYHSKDYFGFAISQEFNIDKDVYYSVKKDDIFIGIMTLQDLLKYKEEVEI